MVDGQEICALILVVVEASMLFGSVICCSPTQVVPVGTWWDRAFYVALTWSQFFPLVSWCGFFADNGGPPSQTVWDANTYSEYRKYLWCYHI